MPDKSAYRWPNYNWRVANDVNQQNDNQSDNKGLTPKNDSFDLDDLIESAIEAEKSTGRRESTDEKAKRSLIVRTLSIFAGSVICIIGLIMFVTPGPGLLVLAAGLGILSIDVPFAHRLLMIVRNRLPQDELGKITKKAMAFMIVTTLIGIIISIVLTLIAFA